MNKLNASIAHVPLPARMQRLPISDRGFPIPWFVSWFKEPGKPGRRGVGTPDFRGVYPETVEEAYRRSVCWVCGQPLGRHLAFVIGPMCSINRISSEPASHLECALYAVRTCPFMTRPRAQRNDKDLPFDKRALPGFIERNPGVAAVWVTRYCSPVPVPGGMLFEIGKPTSVSWWREGRFATRDEIIASIEAGLPELRRVSEAEGPDAVAALPPKIEAAMVLVPA